MQKGCRKIFPFLRTRFRRHPISVVKTYVEKIGIFLGKPRRDNAGVAQCIGMIKQCVIVVRRADKRRKFFCRKVKKFLRIILVYFGIYEPLLLQRQKKIQQFAKAFVLIFAFKIQIYSRRIHECRYRIPIKRGKQIISVIFKLLSRFAKAFPVGQFRDVYTAIFQNINVVIERKRIARMRYGILFPTVFRKIVVIVENIEIIGIQIFKAVEILAIIFQIKFHLRVVNKHNIGHVFIISLT